MALFHIVIMLLYAQKLAFAYSYTQLDILSPLPVALFHIVIMLPYAQKLVFAYSYTL